MFKKILMLSLLLCFVSLIFNVETAFSKAGGGKSFGSTGTHSYSGGSKYVNPNLNTPKSTVPTNPNYNQKSSSQNQPSFLRNFFGGLAGALAGMALFSILGSLFGFSGPNSSIAGFFLILIILILVIYLINFFMKRRTSQNNLYDYDKDFADSKPTQVVDLGSVQAKMDVDNGLSEIEKLFPSFSEEDVRHKLKNIFLEVQRAWSEKDVEMLKNFTSDEVFLNFQKQIEELNKRDVTNIIKNISVKRMELVDAWVEDKTIYLTYKIEATMMDYDIDRDGNIVRGKDELVDFHELWSFVSEDSINWKLTAINQI